MPLPTSGLDPQRLRPQASPVDTFAPSTAGRGLSQLAQGLASLQPSLARYGELVTQRDQTENTARGEQAARDLADKRVNFRDAVGKGLIDPHENPWFVYGAKVQMGRAAASKYGSDLMETIAADPQLQESGDLNAFDAKESEFRKKWLEDNVGASRDQTFDKGFGAISDGYVQDARRSFAAAAGARLEKTAGENHGVIVGQALEEASKTGDFTTAVKIINGETADYIRDNPKAGRIANRVTVQAVEDWARLHYKDVTQDSITEIMKGIDAGPGSKLFGTHEAKEMIAKASNVAVQLRQQDLQVADEKDKKDRKDGEQRLYTDMFAEFKNAGDPSTVKLDTFLARAAKYDPSPNGIANVWQLRDAFVQAKASGDPKVYESALLRVYGVNSDQPGYLTMRGVAQLAPALSAQQLGSLFNEVQQRDTAAANGETKQSRLLNDPVVRSYRGILLKQMGYDEFGTNDPEIKARSGAAESSFLSEVLSRRDELSTLSPKALGTELEHMVDRTFKSNASGDMLEFARDVGKQVQDTQAAVAKGEFKDAITKLSHGDEVPLTTLRSEVDKLQTPKGRAAFTKFTDSDIALLARLGVPPKLEKIKQFFLELDRTPRK